MPRFERYIGIDYSGAETPTSSLKGLRAFEADGTNEPREIPAPPSPRTYWTRRGLAESLCKRLGECERTLIGIDHAFSFPLAYFVQHDVTHDWDSFLDDFCAHWPTQGDDVYVDFVRNGAVGSGNLRGGDAHWRRLTEVRCGASSVFHFDVPGSVAKSTHAGIPWLRYLRKERGTQTHFWPFDGWAVRRDVHVLTEVYPALWRAQYPADGRTPDQQDAYTVCRWMQEVDASGALEKYLKPQLSLDEEQMARVEGWILGVA